MLKAPHGRPASPASARWNVVKTFLQMIVFWTLFLAVFPLLVAWLEEQLGLARWRFFATPWRVLGVLVFLAGSVLGVASAITMATVGQGTPLPIDCPRELVVVGPYRFLRNPMAVAGVSQGVGVGLLLGSPAVVVYALAGALVWNYLVRPWEERDLEQRFGESYRSYRRKVRCWWPHRSGGGSHEREARAKSRP